MKKKIDPFDLMDVCNALQCSNAKTAIGYIDAKTIVRATWRFKPSSRNRREEMIVTIGEPNYLERAFIEKCKKGKIAIMNLDIQLRPYPKKKKKT
jgi:hypothetical protein